MSSAVSCPRCNRLVALPATGDPAVWLRCPLCREEYRLIDVLNYAPPMLEVVTEPHVAADLHAVSAAAASRAGVPVPPVVSFAGAFGHAAQLPSPHLAAPPGVISIRPIPRHLPIGPDDELPDHPHGGHTPPANDDGVPDLLTEPGHEYQSRPDDNLIGAGDEFAFDSDETKQAPSFKNEEVSDSFADAIPAMTFEAGAEHAAENEIDENSPWREKPGLPAFPSTQHIHARRQRKPSNPVAELAKIVGGGAAGLLLGYFIVLWGLKVDLLHIAKHLPTFMVPEVLRAPDATSAKGNGGSLVDPSTPSSEAKWNPYSMPSKESGSKAPNKPVVHTPDIPPPEEMKPVEIKPVEPKPIEPKPNETAQATSLNSDAMASKPRGGDFPPPPELPEEPPLIPEGPKAEKTFAYGDAAKAMSDVSDAAAERNAAPEDLSETNPAEFNRLRKVYYVALAKLAETVTMLRPQAHEEKETTARHAAAALVQSLADDEAKQQELGVLASAWLASTKRTDTGIVLAGVAQKPEAVGKQYRTVVRLYGSSAPVVVLTSSKPELTDRNPALVLGVIVDDPAKNLHDYLGDDKRVIWAAAAVDPTHPEPSDSSGKESAAGNSSDGKPAKGDSSSGDSSNADSANMEPMPLGL